MLFCLLVGKMYIYKNFLKGYCFWKINKRLMINGKIIFDVIFVFNFKWMCLKVLD